MLFIKYELALQWHWDLSLQYWPGNRSFKFTLPENALMHCSAQSLLTWEDLKTIQHTEACVEGLITVRKHVMNCRLYKLLVVHLVTKLWDKYLSNTRKQTNVRGSLTYTISLVWTSDWLSESHPGCHGYQWCHTWASMVILHVTMVLIQLGLWVAPVTTVMHVKNKRKLGSTVSDIIHRSLLRWLQRGCSSTLILCYAIKQWGQV